MHDFFRVPAALCALTLVSVPGCSGSSDSDVATTGVGAFDSVSLSPAQVGSFALAGAQAIGEIAEHFRFKNFFIGAPASLRLVGTLPDASGVENIRAGAICGSALDASFGSGAGAFYRIAGFFQATLNLLGAITPDGQLPVGLSAVNATDRRASIGFKGETTNSSVTYSFGANADGTRVFLSVVSTAGSISTTYNAILDRSAMTLGTETTVDGTSVADASSSSPGAQIKFSNQAKGNLDKAKGIVEEDYQSKVELGDLVSNVSSRSDGKLSSGDLSMTSLFQVNSSRGGESIADKRKVDAVLRSGENSCAVSSWTAQRCKADSGQVSQVCLPL